MVAFWKTTTEIYTTRLLELYLLIKNSSMNEKKLISVDFSSQIIVVLGENRQKRKKTNNQLVNVSSWKELPHNKDITRTFIKEKEIKDCKNFTVGNKCDSTPKQIVSAAQGYQNTTWIRKTKKYCCAKIMRSFLNYFHVFKNYIEITRKKQHIIVSFFR